MIVDFEMRKAPQYRVATRILTGAWPGDKALRAEFEKVHAWAKEKGLRTGKWFFREFGEDETPSEKWRFEIGVEIRGTRPVRGGKGTVMKTLPSSTVATVTFDPDKVSPRVIYHGLADWLRERKKAGEYKEVGPYREVYLGNPWSSKPVWAHTQIQVSVKRLKP
jgi:effector-binding domain-containing protein